MGLVILHVDALWFVTPVMSRRAQGEVAIDDSSNEREILFCQFFFVIAMILCHKDSLVESESLFGGI